MLLLLLLLSLYSTASEILIQVLCCPDRVFWAESWETGTFKSPAPPLGLRLVACCGEPLPWGHPQAYD